MQNLEYLRSKIFDAVSLQKQLTVWRFLNKKIVFTNGCFDILHLGHIDYLAKAADEGDILIVGVNTDRSTQKLKGPKRPINSELQRSMLIAGLHVTDAVILFDEDTPEALIHTIRPDILVKGADYAPKDIVGYEFVTANGGQVKTIELLPGYSTSAIEQKIREK